MAKPEVNKPEVNMKYDARGDVLYFSVGEPREAISYEADDGVIIRTDPETDDVIGITVIDLSKRFTDHPDKPLSLPLIPTHLVPQQA
jgi:uncharacterized protein YuzE